MKNNRYTIAKRKVNILKKDKLLIAGVIGVLSTIPSEIVTRGFLIFGIGKYSVYQLDSFLYTFNRPTPIIGFIVCSVVGGFSAILLYYTFERLGTSNLVIKTSMFGLLLCLFLQILMATITEGKYIDIRPVSDYYTHMLGSVIFGITEGLLFKRFLFKSTTQEN